MIEALIFLNVFFIARLLFFPMNQVLLGENDFSFKFWLRLASGLLLFLFIHPFQSAAYYVLVFLLLVCLDSLIVPKSEQRRVLWYALLFILPFGVLFWRPPFEFQISPLLNNRKLLLVLLGFVLTIKEGTIIIRLILTKLRTVPLTEQEASPQPDPDEYERGKWIGILERTFVYFLIIFNQIGAIALIVALKSLARFNELNRRTFAEYFLIGSFLSLLVAAVPAVLVRLFW